MTLRWNIGLVVTLAVGMALGYAVRPSAQAPQSSVAPPQAQDPTSYKFTVTPAENGRVRFELLDSNGRQQILEDTKFELFLRKDLVIVQSFSRGGAIAQPEVRRGDNGRLPGFAYRMPLP